MFDILFVVWLSGCVLTLVIGLFLEIWDGFSNDANAYAILLSGAIFWFIFWPVIIKQWTVYWIKTKE